MWQFEWKRIREQIDSLVRSAEFLLQTAEVVGTDYAGVANQFLIPAFRKLLDQLRSFSAAYTQYLPPAATQSVNDFVSKIDKRLFGGALSGWPGVQALFTPLLCFSSEFEFLIADLDQHSKSLVERAFLHLKRSIVADYEFAQKWQKAFKLGEIECERLGAVHLLSHGLWGFKINGAGERTDLILSGKIEQQIVAKIDSTLVLTEWKLATPSDIEKKADAAFNQAKRYTQGVLAGLELQSTRYLVLVTEKNQDVPEDRKEGGLTYSFLNIPVSPDPPSKG